MTAGDHGVFLKKATMTKSYGLELMELIISGSPSLLLKVVQFNLAY